MDASAVTKVSIVLNSKDDWRAWYDQIKVLATARRVWRYIDPEVLKEDLPKQPEEPEIPDIDDEGSEHPWKDRMQLYTVRRARFDEVSRGLAAVHEVVRGSISKAHVYHLYGKTSVYEILKTLKQKFAPTTEQTERRILIKWKALLNESIKDRNVEDWLQRCEATYYEGLDADLPDMQRQRPVRDFLNAISGIAPSWAERRADDLQTNTDILLPRMIEIFRGYRDDTSQFQRRGRSEAAFATLKGQSDEISEASCSVKPLPKCLCGMTHRFYDCWYVMTSKRKVNWSPKPDVQAKFDKLLNGPSNPIQRALKHAMEKNNEKSKQIGSDQQEEHAMAVISTGFSTESTYELQNCFILDSGASVHICNDRSRFLEYHEEVDRTLRAGDTIMRIEGRGNVRITPSGKKRISILLKDVAFVPGFHTNLLSARRMKRAGYKWDFANDRILKGQEEICSLRTIHDLWVVEYRPPSKQEAAWAVKKSEKPLILSGDRDLWHQRMGHLSHEAVGHLPEASTGVTLLDTDRTSVQPCETCILSNSIQQISRRPATRETEPFKRVHFDLIQMNEAFNGDRWCTHLYDEATHSHAVYTSARKNGVVEALQDFTNLVKNQYGKPVKIYRSDNERTLGGEFQHLISIEGILHETPPRGHPMQNGPAERSGGVIIRKARSLLINARLPLDLWPLAFKAAMFLLNRSPIRALNWKTPYEILHGKQPNLANLYTFGCRAYMRNQDLKNTEKVAPRALIGYLVGYKASNIWQIWIPKQKRVEEARDVVYDESRLYDPTEPFLEDLIKESSPETPVELLQTPNLEDPVIEDLNIPDLDEVEDVRDTEASGASETSKTGATCEISAPPLLTPDSTPEPTSESALIKDNELESYERPRDESPSRILLESLQSEEIQSSGGEPARTRRPRQEVDPSNIIEGRRPRRKQKDPQFESFAVYEAKADSLLSAFAIGLTSQTPRKRFHRDELPVPPQSWNKMLKHPLRDEFMTACTIEYQAILNKDTVKEVEQIEAGRDRVIPLLWVFTYKFDQDGNFIKAKARICVRGDLQAESEEEKRAATLAARTFRTIMALVAAFDLDTTQYDATNAFLNAFLDEDVYVSLPDGFKAKGKIWKVIRALYGLRRSPRLWQKDLSATLQEFGLQAVNEDQCLFTNHHLMVIFYVDDIIVVNKKDPEARAEAQRFKQALENRYELRYMGEVSWFLGIRVIRDRTLRKLWLCQDSYIDKMAARYHLDDRIRSLTTPMGCKELLPREDQATPAQIHHYQQKVGSILYATVISRPDVARTANKLAEFLMNPTEKHIEAADRAIAYLHATRYLAIEYSGLTNQNETFMCASDASFADHKDRKSTEGYLCKLYGGPIDWKASKQRTVTTSTTEAELLAISEAAKSTFWWKRLFESIEFDPEHQISILCDNQQTINLLTKEDPQIRTKLRHVDIHGQWLRQEVQAKHVNIRWVPSAEMPADGLTKILPDQKHQEFMKTLGLVDVKSLITD